MISTVYQRATSILRWVAADGDWQLTDKKFAQKYLADFSQLTKIHLFCRWSGIFNFFCDLLITEYKQILFKYLNLHLFCNHFLIDFLCKENIGHIIKLSMFLFICSQGCFLVGNYCSLGRSVFGIVAGMFSSFGRFKVRMFSIEMICWLRCSVFRTFCS